jgi:CDP-2,3-bis-(O-geranylgeranyl)-sn-glycerol synthase
VLNITLGWLILALVSALWVMMPAYIPNPAAAALGGGAPIDGGRILSDGRRLFGEGKTWRGLYLGIAAGLCAGGIEILAQRSADLAFLPGLTWPAVALLAVGALLGDLAKSYVKRRIGKKQGEEWLIADQYDLVAGAFALTLIFDPGWFFQVMTLPVIVIILLITPILHRLVNWIGFRTGIKDVPW